jgi:hypothetical protein
VPEQQLRFIALACTATLIGGDKSGDVELTALCLLVTSSGQIYFADRPEKSDFSEGEPAIYQKITI